MGAVVDPVATNLRLGAYRLPVAVVNSSGRVLLVVVAGLTGATPSRSTHGASDAALVVGGSIPRPGQVSLAHKGVLFLDELPEFRRSALESLRQPIENGSITIARALMTVEFAAEIMVVGAMNPCPCRADLKRIPSCSRAA